MEGNPKKEPRSSRLCILCGHLYESQIDVKCLKVLCSEPRIECECTHFVGNLDDLRLYEQIQLNTFKEIPVEEMQIENQGKRVFDFCKVAPTISTEKA